MTPEQINQMSPYERVRALRRVVLLCNSYTPQPPPIFRGPGLSEHGIGYNRGTRDLADAVLGVVAGEPGDDE